MFLEREEDAVIRLRSLEDDAAAAAAAADLKDVYRCPGSQLRKQHSLCRVPLSCKTVPKALSSAGHPACQTS